jgi:hypothetical protein
MITEKNGLLVEILPLFSRIPPLPPYFVSRPQKEQEIIRLIEKSLEQPEQSSNLAQNIVVLYGYSGYGKTTLALALCHNPRIKEIFSGDISWIDIEKKDINFQDGELKQNLTDRRCLVVLDNLWEISKLKKFLREGIFSRCTWLITTQRIEGIRQCHIDISCGYPKVQTVDIDGMSHNEAEQLLRYGLPEVDRNKLKRLVDRLYEVPLLINFIREKISERVSENEDLIDQALDSVIEDLKAGIYKVVTYYDEQEWWKRFTVFSECLTKEEQEYFKELFIFQSHVEIPFHTVGKLWNPDLQLSEIRYICEKFKKLSLVKCIQNTIILNDFLRKYWIDDELKKKLPYLHYKLVKAYEDLPGGTKLAEEEETYLCHSLPYHLKKASKWNKNGNPVPSPCLMHILHLSDLHFGTLDNARDWSTQLAEDLRNDLSIPHLDALILSGDIANSSTEEEYIAAEQFLHNLQQDFPLKPEQIILVPGNHDINWKATNWEMADDVAYTLKLRRQCKPHELQEGYYIEESSNALWVRDEEKYKQRFAHFSQFYEAIKQKPYPLDYDQQYTLDHLPEQNLLILGLNSAWQLDHHFKSRASIHMGALSNALTQIRSNRDYDNCLKIAVWHHPLNSAWEDRITDHGFTELLAVAGFRLYLHGHIHQAQTSLYRYDMSTNGRKLDRICAGTFGAPVREWVPGYPLQYNLLKIADNQLSVYTRRREELNGAWKPDARWLQGAGKPPLDYYEISLS